MTISRAQKNCARFWSWLWCHYPVSREYLLCRRVKEEEKKDVSFSPRNKNRSTPKFLTNVHTEKRHHWHYHHLCHFIIINQESHGWRWCHLALDGSTTPTKKIIANTTSKQLFFLSTFLSCHAWLMTFTIIIVMVWLPPIPFDFLVDQKISEEKKITTEERVLHISYRANDPNFIFLLLFHSFLSSCDIQSVNLFCLTVIYTIFFCFMSDDDKAGCNGL